MSIAPLPFLVGDLSNFDQQVLALEDSRPYPVEDALRQLGTAIITELLDLTANTGLEDYQSLIAEAFIGGIHSAAQRIEREADRARDDVNRLHRDFDGSEVADHELQEAISKTRRADVALMAVEYIRDEAAAVYTVDTGEVWTPWQGNVRASKTTAAQIQAKDYLKAVKVAKSQLVPPGTEVVAFRGSKDATTQVDAERIFDALNWAKTNYPNMALAVSTAPGADAIALRWATSKKVNVIRINTDFTKFKTAAPFRANDEMLKLDPVCSFTLPASLNPIRASETQPSGIVLNYRQKAEGQALKQFAIAVK